MMDIYDLKVKPIERIEAASQEDVARIMPGARRPLIFSGLDSDFEFLREWNLNFFSRLNSKVPVQKPASDGINYFIKHFTLPMTEFVERIKSGEDLYIGARKITRDRGERTDEHGLGDLVSSLTIPPWVDRSRISTTNLWIGAGNNRTLLHYDPWDGVMMLAEGKKEFVILPGTETSKMYPYGALNYKALYLGEVLHSKIQPLDVQEPYRARFSKAEGYRGTITAGEMIFIPAGFWHYVQSSGLNIGINFFIHFEDRSLQLTEPLRTYWVKDNITLWPVRWFMKFKAMAFRTIRLVFPKKNIE
jgi:hypothetical protein